MGAITDDAPIEFSFVPDDELTGYTRDEAYAFLAGVGPNTSELPKPQPGAKVGRDGTGRRNDAVGGPTT